MFLIKMSSETCCNLEFALTEEEYYSEKYNVNMEIDVNIGGECLKSVEIQAIGVKNIKNGKGDYYMECSRYTKEDKCI